jgi:hypothetical protein
MSEIPVQKCVDYAREGDDDDEVLCDRDHLIVPLVGVVVVEIFVLKIFVLISVGDRRVGADAARVRRHRARLATVA